MNTMPPSARKTLIVIAISVAGMALIHWLTGCSVRVPIPPSGDSMGRYGYIEGRVSYVPNFDTIFNTVYQPTKTINDK